MQMYTVLDIVRGTIENKFYSISDQTESTALIFLHPAPGPNKVLKETGLAYAYSTLHP